jgi:hypothetical protein
MQGSNTSDAREIYPYIRKDFAEFPVTRYEDAALVISMRQGQELLCIQVVDLLSLNVADRCMVHELDGFFH